MREGLSEIRGKAKPRGGRRYYTWILSRRAFLCSNKPVKAISSRLTYENENALKAFLLRLRTEFHFRKEESLRSEEERKKGGVAHRGIREGAISLPSLSNPFSFSYSSIGAIPCLALCMFLTKVYFSWFSHSNFRNFSFSLSNQRCKATLYSLTCCRSTFFSISRVKILSFCLMRLFKRT